MSEITSIQITQEENKEIARLKKELGFSSKKAVILEGLHILQRQLQEAKRRGRLQKASLLVGKNSLESNRQWAPHSSALKKA